MMRRLQLLLAALFTVLGAAEACAVDYEYVPLVREGRAGCFFFKTQINTDFHGFVTRMSVDLLKVID